MSNDADQSETELDTDFLNQEIARPRPAGDQNLDSDDNQENHDCDDIDELEYLRAGGFISEEDWQVRRIGHLLAMAAFLPTTC